MEVQIHCIDRDTFTFTVGDRERGLALIESIKPSEFFNQPTLRIQAGNRTCIFNCRLVESIFFNTTMRATLREQHLVSNCVMLLEPEYQERIQVLRRECEACENLFAPGRSIETLLAIHCMSGDKHFLQVEIVPGLHVEQLMDLHTRLGRLTSVIPCRSGGYIAINPAALKRIEIYPAPVETTLSAWLVD